MLKTVYFDLGNVILFFNHSKMFQQIADLLGIESGQVKSVFAEKKILETYEVGKICSDDFYHIFQSLSSRPFSFPELMEAASNIFTPNLEVLTLIEQLKKQKIRLVLLSNTSECHFNKACNFCPILKIFDSFVLSFQVGFLKPSMQIFEKAIEAAEAPLSKCFYTDDVPAFIEGAKKAGLNGEVFTSASALKKQLVARGCDFLH